MKKRLMAMLMVMMMIALAACGKKTDKFVGLWKAATVETGGVSVDFEEYAKQLGQDITMTIDVKEDNTLTMSIMEETADGTWEAKDGKYLVTVDGEEQELTMENDELIIEDESFGKVVFKK